MKQRTESLELLRFLAAMVVMFFHFNAFYGMENSVMKLAPVVVDFFFMLTGFFMMKSISKSIDALACPETLPYVFRKARGIWPMYFAALCIAFIVKVITTPLTDISAIIMQLFHFKWEFLMLHMAGFNPNPQFNTDYLSPVSWFVSSMMIALIPAYFLASHLGKKFSGFLAPLCMALIYACIMKNYQKMDVGNEYLGCVLLGNLRAFAGISAGAFTFYLSGLVSDKNFSAAGNILNLLVWLALPVLVFGGTLLSQPDALFFIVVYMNIIIHGYLNRGIVSVFLNNHGAHLWGYLGKLSLYIYLLHTSILFMMMKYFPGQTGIGGHLSFFLVVMLGSMLFMFCMEHLTKKKN